MSVTKCQAIVISTVKYGDASLILKCYTDNFGMQSYMINSLKGKVAVIKPAQLQILTLMEIESFYARNKNLQRLKEVKCFPVLYHIPYEITKTTIAIFVAETISRCIREENHPDIKLFGFLQHAVQILDLENKNLANFPCYFLIQLSKYIGFSTEFESGNNFTEETIGLIRRLRESSFSNYHQIEIPKRLRNEILESVLSYYSGHMAEFGKLKSLDVLHSLFETSASPE